MRILTCAEMGYICTYRKPIKSPIIRPDKKHIMMMIGSQLIDSFNKLKSVHTLLILSSNWVNLYWSCITSFFYSKNNLFLLPFQKLLPYLLLTNINQLIQFLISCNPYSTGFRVVPVVARYEELILCENGIYTIYFIHCYSFNSNFGYTIFTNKI